MDEAELGMHPRLCAQKYRLNLMRGLQIGRERYMIELRRGSVDPQAQACDMDP